MENNEERTRIYGIAGGYGERWTGPDGAGWIFDEGAFYEFCAALAARPAVPPGWKLVPVEPTHEMFAAARKHNAHPTVRKDSHWDAAYRATYRRMVDAAPPPPSMETLEGKTP